MEHPNLPHWAHATSSRATFKEEREFLPDVVSFKAMVTMYAKVRRPGIHSGVVCVVPLSARFRCLSGNARGNEDASVDSTLQHVYCYS